MMQNEELKRLYQENAVIAPPEAKEKEGTRSTRVVVDSKDRDKSLFKNPNAYEIVFDDQIEDVVSAKLLNIKVPLSQYMVNKYFDTINVKVGTTSYDIAIPHGMYNVDNLATATSDALNSVISSGQFQVTYDSVKDNFVFKSSTTFVLSFPNDVSRLYGFAEKTEYVSSQPIDVGSPFKNVVVPPFRKDFEYNNYVVMTIDQFDINKSTNSNLVRSFAILTLDYSTLNISDAPQITKSFSPPISRLQKLRIRFFDRFGNPYDFNNMEHHFEMVFESLKQQRKYTSIFNR